MKLAFLFPGQATDIGDAVGAWRSASPHAAHLLERAADVLGSGIEELARPAMLARTSVFQPVITALTIGIHRTVVELGMTPDLVAGHSVGELAACAAAGPIDDADAVRVAATRGELMEREASRHGGGMIAVRGSASDVEAAIARGSAHGQVCLAAHNAPDEWVLSGDLAALRAIASATSAAPLETRGPWHSPAMAGASGPYRDALRRVMTGRPTIPTVPSHRDELVDHLVAQLTSPVQWVHTMQALRDAGVTSIVVCGPGKSLRRFARAVIPEASVSVLAHPSDLPRGAPAVAP